MSMKLTEEEKIKRAKREYLRKYRENNRDKINAYHKEYRQAHKDKIKEYNQNYWKRKAKDLEE